MLRTLRLFKGEISAYTGEKALVLTALGSSAECDILRAGHGAQVAYQPGDQVYGITDQRVNIILGMIARPLPVDLPELATPDGAPSLDAHRLSAGAALTLGPEAAIITGEQIQLGGSDAGGAVALALLVEAELVKIRAALAHVQAQLPNVGGAIATNATAWQAIDAGGAGVGSENVKAEK